MESITSLKICNDGRFLDFDFQRISNTLPNKNLARAPALFAFQRFTTIPYSKYGFNPYFAYGIYYIAESLQ